MIARKLPKICKLCKCKEFNGPFVNGLCPYCNPESPNYWRKHTETLANAKEYLKNNPSIKEVRNAKRIQTNE